MSAALEQVRPEVFDSVNYYDKRTVGANVVRWVFNPLDLIVPERKAEISWLKVGGEESSCPCLQRYGRGFMPRGLASILEMGGEPIPMQHLGDLQAVAWQGIALSEEVVKNKFGFVPVFPGDGLRILRRYSMNPVRKGIDEATALVGKEWDECHTPEKDGILDVIELAMFGDGMEKTLKGLENQIRHANITDTRIDVGLYKNDALRMCEDSRNWAMRLISVEHGLLKTGHVGEWQGGWSYSYSPVCEMLIEQLEISRQDQPMQELAKMFANQPHSIQPQGMSAADMDIFERRMDEKLAAARAADAARIQELEAQVAAKSEPEAEVFSCDGCGRTSPTLAGKKAHERACESLNPETPSE